MRTSKVLGVGALAVAGLTGSLAAFSALSARSAERKVPAEGRFITIDGARLHYIDIGSGPPIVLVHGLTGQLRNFTYRLTELLVQDHRVIVVDRPGSGYSGYVGAGGRGLYAQAAILGRFIKALQLDKPVLTGHSLGGAISLTLALQSPELLGGVALIAPLTQPVDKAPGVFKLLTIASKARRAFVAGTLAVPLGKLKRKKSLDMIFAPDPVPADFAEAAGGALAGRPSAFYAASTEVTDGMNDLAEIVADYQSITLPVGILFGRGDRILSPDLHGVKTAATIPGAEHKLIDGGHMIPLTAARETASWLLEQAARSVARTSAMAASDAQP